MAEFLYIDPLKQGLKLEFFSDKLILLTVFIHRSIKTRIETRGQLMYKILYYRFYT